MAYIVPTADDLKSRFPEFADVADATIDPFIQAALLWVDESWFERDYPYAIIYLAAHYLTMYQRALAAGATGGGGGGGTGETAVQTYVSDIKFEDFQVKFGTSGRVTTTTGGAAGISAGAALMASTPYGMLFTQLLKRNVVPAAIV
jgi:hypothetical protein